MTRLLVVILIVAMALALISAHIFHEAIVTFVFSALSLILLSKFLGNATEHLSRYVGESFAGLLNVTLSNLAELIIIYVAVRENMVDLVQAGIVGSMIGNLLLVMGMAIYIGCKKNGTMSFNPDTATLFINMLFLVTAALIFPTLFSKHIPSNRQLHYSYVLAFMLFAVYVYFYHLARTDQRFKEIHEQIKEPDGRWTKFFSLSVLILAAVGAFIMSEMLIGEVESVAKVVKIPRMFIGFILLPLLGNIAEHFVAVTAAWKGKVELSLAISVGSAAQVGMIVAPCAVLFGLLTGNPLTLYFATLPVGALIITFFAAFIVLRDNNWNINEGIMLMALYACIVVAFWFTR